MKLTIEHIQHYLAYGLRVQYKNEIKKVVGLNVDYHPTIEVRIDDDVARYASIHIAQTKPLLLPLSALYEEIDGEVGIVELFKMYETREFDKDKKYSVVFDAPIIDYKWEVYPSIIKEEGILRFIRKTSNMGDLVHSFRYDPELRRFSMYDDTNRRPLAIAYQLDLFDYLFSHHYDVYDLCSKGLAIDKTKI